MELTQICKDNLQTMIDTLKMCIDECHTLDDHIAYSDAIYYLELIKQKGMVMNNAV